VAAEATDSGRGLDLRAALRQMRRLLTPARGDEAASQAEARDEGGKGMSQDRMRILRFLQDGRISAEEADRLLEALQQPATVRERQPLPPARASTPVRPAPERGEGGGLEDDEELIGASAPLGSVIGRVELTGAALSGLRLEGARMDGADLTGAVLTGADLRGADLRDACLTGAMLAGANLKQANLRDADLTGSMLPRANLQGASLENATLVGVNFGDGADLHDLDFSELDLTGVDLTSFDVRRFLQHDADDQHGDAE